MKRYIRNSIQDFDTLEALIDAFEYYTAFQPVHEYSDKACFDKSIKRVNKQIQEDPEYFNHGPVTEEEIEEFKDYLLNYGYDVENTDNPNGQNFEFRYR